MIPLRVGSTTYWHGVFAHGYQWTVFARLVPVWAFALGTDHRLARVVRSPRVIAPAAGQGHDPGRAKIIQLRPGLHQQGCEVVFCRVCGPDQIDPGCGVGWPALTVQPVKLYHLRGSFGHGAQVFSDGFGEFGLHNF